MSTAQGAISKRRKFVADGVFYAELNEFFQRELAEEGYSGVEVRVTPTVTDISMYTFFLGNLIGRVGKLGIEGEGLLERRKIVTRADIGRGRAGN